MKRFNVIFAGLMSFGVVLGLRGMDESSLNLGESPFPSSGPHQFSFALSGGTSSNESEPSTYAPLANENFIRFHRYLNEYQAKKSLLSFQLGWDVSNDKLNITPLFKKLTMKDKGYNEKQIEDLKQFVNAEYFRKYPDDLCKALPFFLEDIDKYGKFAKRDAQLILDLLLEKNPKV